jgi:hypothetical protein
MPGLAGTASGRSSATGITPARIDAIREALAALNGR